MSISDIVDVMNSAPRSLSIDNLDNHSPASGRHSLGSSPINVVSTAFLSLDSKGYIHIKTKHLY